MTRWLSVVGLGEDGMEGLMPAARALVETAEVLVGGARHLALVPERPGVERLAWAAPLARTVDAIAERRGRRVAVLATGDPMSYGVGVTLARRFAVDEMLVLPAPGAFSLAAARLGWPLADADCLTLHGRPLDLLDLHLAPDARLLILCEDGGTPAAVAARLVARGYGDSPMVTLEHMGGPLETRHEARARDWGGRRVADLNTLAVACAAGPDALVRSRAPGLPDEAYENDGQLTKREVRAATLAALMPLPGALLWDVGAGSGSIAIEWMRAARGASAIAVERGPGRAAAIARNAAALGVPKLRVVQGEAPAALDGLPAPDAVFLGGGLSDPDLADRCWQALRPGGRLVANAVTVEGESVLFALRGRLGGTLARIAVSRAEPVGPFTGWRPLMPVTQFAVGKPRG